MDKKRGLFLSNFYRNEFAIQPRQEACYASEILKLRRVVGWERGGRASHVTHTSLCTGTKQSQCNKRSNHTIATFRTYRCLFPSQFIIIFRLV